MSGAGSGVVIMQGGSPAVADTTLWDWDTSGDLPTVRGYPSGFKGQFTTTKTGLTPDDLQRYVGVPLQYYGNPPTPVLPTTIQEWIRWAEDKVEQETTILLCQTWIASPPALTEAIALSVGLTTKTGNGQRLGFDYDLEDTAYDFMFPRAQDSGWMYFTTRYRPVQCATYNNSLNASTTSIGAIKNIAYIYPLLNTYFRVPPPWFVEDRNFGYIRLVPATNVMMLPLFAMQLAFMGFSESVPGGIWVQYVAGLTPLDYQSHYSFMKELVLAEASLTALSSIQGTINMGFEATQMSTDGLSMRFQYPKNGPFGPLIDRFEKRKAELMKTASTKVSGPMLNVW